MPYILWDTSAVEVEYHEFVITSQPQEQSVYKGHQSKDAVLSANKISIQVIREFLIRSHSLRKLNINKFTFFISSLLFPEHHLKSLQIKLNHLCLWGQIQPGNHFLGAGLATSVRCLRGSASGMAFTYVHTGIGSNWRVGKQCWLQGPHNPLSKMYLSVKIEAWLQKLERRKKCSFLHFQKQENSYQLAKLPLLL